MRTTILNPILNSPFDPPERHFELGPHGPTGTILEGRRPSESFIPVPVTKKNKNAEQQALDFDSTGERREVNSLINDIRRDQIIALLTQHHGRLHAIERAFGVSRRQFRRWAEERYHLDIAQYRDPAQAQAQAQAAAGAPHGADKDDGSDEDTP